MRFIFRNYLLRLVGLIEVFLSFLLIFSVVLAAAGLVLNLYGLWQKPNDTSYFQKYLGSTMALIIALELIKMILRDTISSTIEVLLIAISRKLIVSEGNPLDFLIGIIAIAFLFLIRKYLFVSEFSTDSGVIVSAAMPVAEAEKLLGRVLPRNAHTVGGVVAQSAEAAKRKLKEGEIYNINGVKVRINRMENGIIQVVEFLMDGEKRG
ncbi:MAG TPA: phosphate-starvation-inducible PsiE family protein [Capillibacterium sp.]